jgi:hypothetical protein
MYGLEIATGTIIVGEVLGGMPGGVSTSGGAAKRAGQCAIKSISGPNQYSVAFKSSLATNLYPGKGYYSHFKAANTALADAMASDAAFAKSMSMLGISVPRSATGTIIGKSPSNWVWHHDIDAGVMQLVPGSQHSTGSLYWYILHPNGRGGMSDWGK